MVSKGKEFRASGVSANVEGYFEYTQLANAIISMAVDDYKTAAIHSLHCNFIYDDRINKAKSTKREIRRFIGSKWYRVLTQLPGDIIIKELDRIDNQYKKE